MNGRHFRARFLAAVLAAVTSLSICHWVSRGRAKDAVTPREQSAQIPLQVTQAPAARPRPADPAFDFRGSSASKRPQSPVDVGRADAGEQLGPQLTGLAPHANSGGAVRRRSICCPGFLAGRQTGAHGAFF
jgi:hypothetical protein